MENKSQTKNVEEFSTIFIIYPMKKISLHILLKFVFTVCICASGFAQTGWQWAIGSTVYNKYIYGDNALWSIGAPNIATDKFGNVFLSGVNLNSDSARFGSFTIDNMEHYEQLIIVKVDSFGNYVGVFSTRGDYHYPVSVTTDRSGNFYYIDIPSNSNSFLSKMNYNSFGFESMNLGAYSRTFTGMNTDQHNNLYVVGNFYSAWSTKLTFRGVEDIFISKSDSFGHYLWFKSFGGKGQDNTGGAGGVSKQMTVTNSGKIYVFGKYDSDTMYMDSSMIIVNPYGNKMTNFLAMFDSSGSLVWIKNVSANWHVRGMVTDELENLYLTGEVYSKVVFGDDTIGMNNSWHFALVKYAPSGNILWARAENGKCSTTSTGISVDKCGNIWTSGAVNAGSAIKFEEDSTEVPIYSTDPLFISHFDTSGQYISSMVFPTGGTPIGANGVAVDNYGNFYVGGQYVRQTVFGDDTLTCGDSVVMYIAKYKYSNSNCDKLWVNSVEQIKTPAKEILVYPNPANNEIYIVHTDEINSVIIFNLLGQIVGSYAPFPDQKISVRIDDLVNGVYFIKINGTEIRRFVKQ